MQPVSATQEKQKQLWVDLILNYCRHYKISELDTNEKNPLFNNEKINSMLMVVVVVACVAIVLLLLYIYNANLLPTWDTNNLYYTYTLMKQQQQKAPTTQIT